MFKLLVVLLALLACARGQPSQDVDAELNDLLAQIENEPLTFPEVPPVVVGRNVMGPLDRFAATSALPIWALALIGFSGAIALVATAALIFSIVSKDLGKNKTFGIVFSIVLLVAAAAGVAVALGVGYTTTVPSTGLKPGSRFVIENGVTRVVPTTTGNVWRIVLLSSDGQETTTFFPIQDAGLSVSSGVSGDATALPPVNSVISASVFVTHDGKVLFESWAVRKPASGRVAQVTGTKRVAAYRVAFTSNDCGGGTACQAICSENDIKTLLMTGRQSVNNFYTTVSRGLFSFDSIDVYDVSVDPSKVKTFSTLAAIGKKTADYHIMFFPPNTGWDAFASAAAGYGGVGDTSSWIKACNFPTVGHEMAHNFGLHHAGATSSTGAWVEYGDASSVMGSAYLVNWDASNQGAPAPGLGWVGLGAAQIYQNGWLPEEAVLNIDRNGVYEIPNSLSSNRGVRCAKIATSPELWLEWREGVNQDVDLRYTQMFFDQQKHRNAEGRVMNALLVKTFKSDRKSSLEGFVQAGGRLTVGGVTISRGAGSSPGTFVVNGLAGSPVDVPTVSTTTTTTTTRWSDTTTTTTSRGSSGASTVSLVCATGVANIRSQPSTSGSPIGSARSGEAFQLVTTTGSWSQVRRSCSGSTMFISSSLLRSCGSTSCGGGGVATVAPTSTPTTSMPNPTASVRLMCATSNANKRSQPSTSGSVVGSAASGSSMVLIETSGSWTRLRDCRGTSSYWISSSLLRACGTSTTC